MSSGIAGGDDRARMFGLLLFVGTVATFLNAVHFDFVNLDDSYYVYESPLVRSGLTLAGVWTACSTFINSNWHPLTTLSYMLDSSIYGLNPAGFHLTNVLLHAANASLVFLLFRQMTGSTWRSLAVALLFALHPLRVESVVWVSERKDVLSTLFALASLIFYVHWSRGGRRRDFVLAWALYTAGLLSKPMLVTLPFLLLLLDFWPLCRWGSAPLEEGAGAASSRPGWRSLLAEKIPFLLPSLGISVVTYMAQAASGAMMPAGSRTFVAKAAQASVCYVLYLWKTLVPKGLSAFYPEPADGFPLIATVGATGLLVAIGVGAAARARQEPYLIVGWLWFLGTLVPTIGFIKVGAQLIADRYTYLPNLGLTLAIVWLLADGLRQRAALTKAAVVGFAGIMVAFTALTVRQVDVWENSYTLWTHAIDVGTDSFTAQNLLGKWLFEHQRYSEALGHFRRLATMEPGVAYGYRNLGVDLLKLRQVEEGIAQLKRGVDLEPDVSSSQSALAEAYERRSDFASAEIHWRAAVRLKPLQSAYYFGLGGVLMRRGATAEAQQVLAEATRLDPYGTRALFQYAWPLATDADASMRDGATALVLANRLVSIDKDQPKAWDLLAAAYAEEGHFDQAAAAARTALKLASANGVDQPLRAAIQSRLDGYLVGSPYRRLKTR